MLLIALSEPTILATGFMYLGCGPTVSNFKYNVDIGLALSPRITLRGATGIFLA